jgi:hypothetical protein
MRRSSPTISQAVPDDLRKGGVGGGTIPFVAKVRTAAELESMTPAERQALFEASIITDLAEAPVELVERARRRVEERIASDAPRPR